MLDRRPVAGGAAQHGLELGVGEERELVPHDATEEGVGVAVHAPQEARAPCVGEDEPPPGVEDEHGVAHAVDGLLELRARLLGLVRQVPELLVRLLQLLGHRLALLELHLQLRRCS